MRRKLTALTAVMVIFALSAAPVLAEGNEDWPIAPDLERVLADPELLAVAIAQDLRFRQSFHLDTRLETIEALYEHPERSVGTRFAGALLTPEEWAEMIARNDLDFDGQAVLDHYERHPEERAGFGGLRIDHEAGGVLAVYLLPGAPSPWSSDLQQPERLDIRPAFISHDDLLALRELIEQARDEEGPAASVTDSWLDLDRGHVVVGFAPASLEGLAAEELPADFAEVFGREHLRSAPVNEEHDRGGAGGGLPPSDALDIGLPATGTPVVAFFAVLFGVAMGFALWRPIRRRAALP